jgi:tRNA(Leu) C34 or U34 (ribose-2'-O)-methylase TrmL
METVLQPLGRAELKKELQDASVNYHDEVKVGKLRNINRFAMPAVAAVLLVVCATNVVHALTDYNNPKNYRKTYVENIK